jgi:TPR repeat protein
MEMARLERCDLERRRTVMFYLYRRAMAVFVALLTVTGCAATQPATYRGPDLPDDRVAILSWSPASRSSVRAIDGETVGRGKRVKLAPGSHTVRIDYWWKGRVYTHDVTIDVRMGHVYVVNDETHGFAWIEDVTTEEVVAGDLPPYKRDKARRSERARANREISDHFATLSAAACGDARAQYDLGLHYLAGVKPARRDLMKAYVWYGLAAIHGHLDASAAQDRIRDELDPDRLAAADRELAEAQSRECARQPGVSPGNRALPTR